MLKRGMHEQGLCSSDILAYRNAPVCLNNTPSLSLLVMVCGDLLKKCRRKLSARRWPELLVPYVYYVHAERPAS